jgi:hypothetical protein
VEGEHGLLTVQIYQKTDGSLRTEYTFATGENYYSLAGQNLEQLQAYHNRPLVIWGSVVAENQYHAPILNVDRYEAPYPNLKFQLLRGTQKLVTLQGQPVTLFTTEAGQSYVQLIPTGLAPNSLPDSSLIGQEGDLVQQEVLIIPDETFGGYPAMRVFGGGLVDVSQGGQSGPQQLMADKPQVMPDFRPADGKPPAITIETIELVYYTANPGYAGSYPEAMTPYIQPVWRFYGHDSNGTQTEILVQALKEEFLLPEAAPMIQGG